MPERNCENEHIGAPCPACSEPLSADGACWSCDWGPTGEQESQDYKKVWCEILDEMFEPLGVALDRIEPYSMREQVTAPGSTKGDAVRACARHGASPPCPFCELDARDDHNTSPEKSGEVS